MVSTRHLLQLSFIIISRNANTPFNKISKVYQRNRMKMLSQSMRIHQKIQLHLEVINGCFTKMVGQTLRGKASYWRTVAKTAELEHHQLMIYAVEKEAQGVAIKLPLNSIVYWVGDRGVHTSSTMRPLLLLWRKTLARVPSIGGCSTSSA